MKPNNLLTATIITRNAATTLERCLQSVVWVDEIIVIDSGSNDNTLEIAKKLAHKVKYHEWAGFGAQKRYAANLATNNWILSIDADEWLSPELTSSIQKLMQQQSIPNAGYLMNCRNQFMDQWLLHGEGYPDSHLRLFDRRYGNWQERSVHEQVEINGTIGHLKGDLLHQSAQSLSQYLIKQNNYTQLQAELLYAQGKKATIIDLLLRPVWRFIRIYFLRLGILDGIPGLVHVMIGCFNTFSKYAKLRELQTMDKSQI
ncbi:hypothetical protein TI05_08705 [Achromatium sp. WMS3]|nr:hypothetical protein TI05_08705 [Achromatium sp. WMS3]